MRVFNTPPRSAASTQVYRREHRECEGYGIRASFVRRANFALNSIENCSRRQNLPESADRAAIVVSVLLVSSVFGSSADVAPAAEVTRRQYRQKSIELPIFELAGNATVSHRVSRCHLGSAERKPLSALMAMRFVLDCACAAFGIAYRVQTPALPPIRGGVLV
jgi:hypothetical protein